MTEKDLINNVDTSVLLTRSLTDWKKILTKECQCYVMEGEYLCKKFDEINYEFCNKDRAKEILIDNLYALLTYKYFPKQNDEVMERINKIINFFTTNIKSSLQKVSFYDEDEDCDKMSFLPDYCIAFKNGVYDFKNNKWFFKYDIVKLLELNNNIYLYDSKWLITWYINYKFEPLPFDIINTDIVEFINIMKDITKTNKNYCFELMYNMAHNKYHEFSLEKFKHLCEILGYTCLQSFSQNFCILIGSGQNGKNSLFDGCFTNRVYPRVASVDMETIEEDRFVTGSLINKAQNIFLETDAKTITKSKMLKALTGSMYQSVENKGDKRYSSIINCKYIFAGNDKDKIKFSDTTNGFRRRINLYEIFYQWDYQNKYLKLGDYYDTSFSDNLKEIKEDIQNTTTFIYFAMYGIMSATKNFTKNFKFNFNDWSIRYEDIDATLKETIDNITIEKLSEFITNHSEDFRNYIFDENKKPIKISPTISDLGYSGYEGFIQILNDEELMYKYFAEHDLYVSMRLIQKLINNISNPLAFTTAIKKIYKINNIEYLYANKAYIKCRFVGKFFKFID